MGLAGIWRRVGRQVRFIKVDAVSPLPVPRRRPALACFLAAPRLYVVPAVLAMTGSPRLAGSIFDVTAA